MLADPGRFHTMLRVLYSARSRVSSGGQAMAKAAQKSGEDESIMGYFRPILEQNHELLRQRSNDELYARWLKDHPGQKKVPDQVRNGLSNLKSTMRKKLGIRKGKRRR